MLSVVPEGNKNIFSLLNNNSRLKKWGQFCRGKVLHLGTPNFLTSELRNYYRSISRVPTKKNLNNTRKLNWKLASQHLLVSKIKKYDFLASLFTLVRIAFFIIERHFRTWEFCSPRKVSLHFVFFIYFQKISLLYRPHQSLNPTEKHAIKI